MEDGGVDRLGSLPEDLLHKILSSIGGTKHVVQTCVLSSDWRHLWMSIPYLVFSSDGFSDLNRFREFILYVLSRRNNKIEVTSLTFKLGFPWDPVEDVIKVAVDYAVSHNVQEISLTLLFQPQLQLVPLRLFSCASVKNFSLIVEDYGNSSLLQNESWELPSLVNLHLNRCCFVDDFWKPYDGIFTRSLNLKTVTIKNFYKPHFPIRLPLLTDLSLENGHHTGTTVDVVAPKLKNLTIINWSKDCNYTFSAPNLTSLVCKGGAFGLLHLNTTDGFPVLEKADLCVAKPFSRHRSDAPQTYLCLFGQLRSVKSLTLNLEVVEFLASSSPELISQHPSPFTNLKNLSIYPKRLSELVSDSDSDTESDIDSQSKSDLELEEKVLPMSASTLVDNYFLNGCPWANLKMVLREEIIAAKLMSELLSLLENITVQLMDSLADVIRPKLENINTLLTRLPDSKRATFQPRYDVLLSELNFFLNKIKSERFNSCDPATTS